MPSPVEICSLKIEKLSKEHKRSAFDCGNNELNDYLKIRAAQDAKHYVTTVFVATKGEGVLYTLRFFLLARRCEPFVSAKKNHNRDFIRKAY
jgi:hypothetical protein